LQVKYLRENLGTLVSSHGELAFMQTTIVNNVGEYLEVAMKPEFDTAVLDELAHIARLALATPAFVDEGELASLRQAVGASETAGPATVLSILRRFAVGVQVCGFAATAAAGQELHQQAIAKMESLLSTQPGTVAELTEWDEYFNSVTDGLGETIRTHTPEMLAESEAMLRDAWPTLMGALVRKWLSLFQTSPPGTRGVANVSERGSEHTLDGQPCNMSQIRPYSAHSLVDRSIDRSVAVCL
jgi:hypothetical protein